MSRQVLDVLVRAVDDLGELFAIDLLLKHVHRDAILERGQPLGVHADDFGNGRAPGGMENGENRKGFGGNSLDNLHYFFMHRKNSKNSKLDANRNRSLTYSTDENFNYFLKPYI